MSLLAAWLLFPLVLWVLALGCGLLLEGVAALRLPGALLAPAGVAAIVVVAGFTTSSAATASLTVPLIVALAVAGLASGTSGRLSRRAALPLATAGLVFSAYAAPVILSGQATFAGYIKLDDTATFLALTDRVMQHGHSLAGLMPSTYEATLSVNLAHGYPVGALLPFGTARALVGVDGAWIFQPYLAFLAAMLALVLFELCRRLVRSPRLRLVCVVLAAQPALLYGFSLWGGIKELAAAPLVALVPALVPPALGPAARPRHVLPLALAGAALLGVLSVGGVVWLLGAAAVVLFLSLRGGRARVVQAGLTSVAVLVLSFPALLSARSFLGPETQTAVRSGSVLGNLFRPLSALQVFGIWPTGDFRVRPGDPVATWILIGLVGAAALAGLALAARLRAWAFHAYVGGGVLAAALVAAFGSPWIAAKAYAIASPALVLAAAVGCALVISSGRVAEGAVALALVGAGVIWSNALAYQDVNLAPRQQLAELQQIGERFAGQGPSLMTEYQPYGVRHFLRRLDAEGTSELRRRPIPLRDGSLLEKGGYADLAAFQPAAIQVYRTLVLRRSPLASRPPADYRLVWRGHFYDVWQRVAVRPDCGSRALAGRSAAPVAVPVGQQRPTRRTVWLSRGGRYSAWVGGSFRGELTVLLDDRVVGTRHDQLNNAGQFTLFGSTSISAGRHLVEVRASHDSLRPGSGGPTYGTGPLVLSRSDTKPEC